MRYSLLNFIECPVSKTELACVVTKEVEAVIAHVQMSESARINQPGAMFGPAPRFATETWFTEFLRREACEPAPGWRNYHSVVEQGLLISAETGRWYPIRNFVPELLPDHLRDFESDFQFLGELKSVLPEPLYEKLNDRSVFSAAQKEEDSGLHFKQAEMNITAKVDDPSFFVPGRIAPFNPGARDHTIYLLRLFSFCLNWLSQNGSNTVILDSGCGYSWTTEWLMRLGFEPIGIDITRTYLDLAVDRLGPDKLPYVVRADVENLPIRAGVLDAVLCYESFHHVPNRERAMQEFFRILKPGKRVILAEPGAEHELAQGPIEVMKKYGILERGMDLADVERYTAGTGFAPPSQQKVIEFDSTLGGATLTPEFLAQTRATPSNLYIVEKPAATEPAAPVPIQTKLKRRIQELLRPV